MLHDEWRHPELTWKIYIPTAGQRTDRIVTYIAKLPTRKAFAPEFCGEANKVSYFLSASVYKNLLLHYPTCDQILLKQEFQNIVVTPK